VGKKENILFIISVVQENDDSEAGEKVEIVKLTIISKIYYKSTGYEYSLTSADPLSGASRQAVSQASSNGA